MFRKVGMMTTREIRIEDYDYELTEDRIAKYPLERRDHSKLLVYEKGAIAERHFFDLPKLVPQGALMVRNNTRVIRARLEFKKETGAQIEIFCLEPHDPSDYERSFASEGGCEWKCLVGNSKKWHDGEVTLENEQVKVKAKRVSNDGETSVIRFEWDGGKTFAQVLESTGELPIPPYLHRKTEEKDLTTYQTVYSHVKGSVAAPTAGLHFTEEVFGRLREKGVKIDDVTLHVGAGTFKPVKSETIGEHAMHGEVIEVRRETVEDLLAHRGKVVAVGTTSVRTLESLYYIGVRLAKKNGEGETELDVGQWEPYGDESVGDEEALRAIVEYMDKRETDVIRARTHIMIAPGYRFHYVNRLITNFHQPKSTLMLLVAAFVGEDWHKIYDYALAHEFRFLSYGDGCYLVKN